MKVNITKMFYRELFRFFVCSETKIPACVKCVNYRYGYAGDSEPYCKLFQEIVPARVSDRLCGIEGKHYKEIDFVKKT